MATIQSLQEKVQKAEVKVEKCKATIARHEKTLDKKIKNLEKVSGRTVDTNNIDSYKWDENHKSYTYYWEACEVAGKLDDIKGANKKLREAEAILENWKAKLQKEIDKDDFINTIPQVIIDFLNAWKQMAYDWHVKKYEAFVSFKADLYRREAEASKECEGMTYRGRKEYMKEKGLDNIGERLAHFGGMVILEMDRRRDEKERLAYLEATLEGEKRRKAVDLVNRIQDVTGEITDASKLEVNEKLNLDGIIYGAKGNAKVETIGAGGWNVQCWHYRTLVHEIK